MQHVGSDPEAERGRGEVNLSPILVLTLRPRVGGFYVSGKLLVSPDSPALTHRVGPLKKDLTRAGGGEEFGRYWEAQSVVLFTLRAVPPTQLSLFRVSF